jgi:hypothetical protein
MVIDYVVCCRAHLVTLEVELPSYVILKEVWHDSSSLCIVSEQANAVEEKIAMEVRPCLSD